MSERLNLYGFSLSRMRRLFRSQDLGAVDRMRDRLASGGLHRPPEEIQAVSEIIERAVMSGVPFAGLETETHRHWLAANAMAGDEQEWLATLASAYHTSALAYGLWPRYGRYARPEIRAFLRGLVEGVPLFGLRSPSGGPVYAAISLETLRSLQVGLADLREQVVYRVGRKKDPDDEDMAASEFVTEFCEWVDRIREAGLDLWCCAS